MTEITSEDYKSVAKRALKDQVLQRALADLQHRFGSGTALAYQRLPEGPELRFKAHDIRKQCIIITVSKNKSDGDPGNNIFNRNPSIH